MENKRPYWQVGIRLLFSLAATAAFVIIGIKAIGFLMPFVIGWIISAVAAPLVLAGKRTAYSEKAWFGVDRYPRSRRNRRYTLSWHQPLILEVASLVRDFRRYMHNWKAG